jgi:xanthine dehydrogenase YagT iron-sulfur-binding subunit
MTDFDPTRRQLLKGTAAAVATGRLAAEAEAAPAAPERHEPPPAAMNVRLRVNGSEHQLLVDPRTTLLDALRERLHLTGTKKGCDQGQCGACTVIVDGRRVTSCLTLAVMQEGHEITTIEGLGTPRQAASDAGRLRQARRLPVRLLHAGPDLLGRGHARRMRAGIPSHVTGRPERSRRPCRRSSSASA